MADKLNTEGKKFYSNHFWKFSFVQYIFVLILDMVKERFRSVGLGVISTLLYMSSVSSQILGSFDVHEIWAQYHDYKSSSWLNMDGKYSRYVHYFYPIAFLGNINGYPQAFTIFGFFLTIYDLILRWYDVQYWPWSSPDVYFFGTLGIGQIFAIIGDTIAIGYWVIILFFPTRTGNRIWIIPAYWLADQYSSLLQRFGIGAQQRHVIASPFVWPFRIKLAVWQSFIVLTIGYLAAVLTWYQVVYFVDQLRKYKNYLGTLNSLSTVLAFDSYHSVVTIQVGDMEDYVNKLIHYTEPVFVVCTIGLTIGLIVAYLGIFKAAYHFKRIMLDIIEDPTQEKIKEIMKFSSSACVMFPIQLPINSIFVMFTFAVSIAAILLLLAIIPYLPIKWDYIGDHMTQIIVGLLPLVLEKLYLPYLVDRQNRVRNAKYFALVETWFVFAGLVASFIKGLVRILIGLFFTIMNSSLSHISVWPQPYESQDPLYKAFYGCIAMQWVTLGYTVEENENDGEETEQNIDLSIVSNN